VRRVQTASCSLDLAADAVVNLVATSAALDAPVEQAEADAEREPGDGGEDAEDAVVRLGDVRALLQAPHLRVVGREERGDVLACRGVHVVVHRRRRRRRGHGGWPGRRGG
jgi:hypothetical protein